MDYSERRSEREGVGSCVRLSESVPELAIKSGSREARVLKCSLGTVGVLFDEGGFGFGTRQSLWRGSRVLSWFRTDMLAR